MLRDALKGIRVLDFSQVAAGPIATMLLADMGAEIVKVEPPGGDLGRMLGPGWVGKDGALYHAFNRNKRGICIDLKTEEGTTVARRLAARADVLVESMRPGVMDRLGLGYEALRKDHPQLVYCSISAYGQTGPYAGRAGVDGILQADSGLMSIVGLPGAEPCKVQAPVVDVMTGHNACMAIVVKLMQRMRDGEGGHLDVSLFNSAVALQLPSIASYLSDRALPAKLGSAAPYSAPNEAFETADGWIMVAAYMGDRWPHLCRVLGLDDVITEPRFQDSKSRTANRPAMREALNAAFRRQPSEYWLERLLAEDILCARVAGYDDLLRHPQLESNRALVEVEVPGFGPLAMPGFPVNPREENAAPYRRAPQIGEHSREVLAEAGCGAEEIDALFAAGAVR